ncbi:hypothetical protein HPB48_008309 [Haemaphysalis longicornis]|uniref:Serine/threonine-protein kinase greatwall n=1 Tax=Haemaphysalis longicornis TaxID=44386 RepID=A0A9J6FTY4_HAELO|nr:hypothetical protein HPB48_008309 [Haemaphysalis longicornis]
MAEKVASISAAAPAPVDAAMEEKKRTAAKVVTTLFPRVPKVTTLLLDFYIRRESRLDLMREPLCHFCQEEVLLAAQDLLEKLNKQVITYQDIRDTAENLINLHNLCFKRSQDIAKELGDSIRKIIIIVGEMATSLEKVSDVPLTDWMGVGDTIVAKTEKLNLAEFAPCSAPAASALSTRRLSSRPISFVPCKLVSCGLFQRHKQAVIDKVVASVIRSPFLVKYYSCFCTKDALITVMEYICGIDLMRVVDKAVYLPTEECRIVMAQLILAIEHMHLRGLLHRDIKVSNMLIIPGGRCKVIDFDTNKVCIGHFSKRVYKGYFTKTAFEFNDGESAGTVPYMAPEILKRRPYGRACDWWSAGVTFYKLMTGRVPFRGETKEELRDKIINSPLKWPKAKDMVFKMLQKNPVERLGSVTYADIRGHPFYANFNWKRLATEKELFKKMINFAKKSTGPVELKESFFNTSGGASEELDYKRPSDMDVRAGISAYSGGGTGAVRGNSPAELSHVLEGDFIVATCRLAEVRRRMQDSGDQLVLTVLSSSAFRMLESRCDMDEMIKAAGRDTIQLRAIKTACGGSGNFGFKTFEAKAWNEAKKALVKCHVIQTVTNPQVITSGKQVYPGDVLIMIEGAPVDNMDQYAVKAALAKGANEITITIAPMSPVRLKRPSFTRLHETVMTDANLPEPSAKANIEAAPPAPPPPAP